MAGSQRLFHENSFGFARQCTCSEAVHVHFGNIALLLSYPQLTDFAAFITDTLAREVLVEDASTKSIYLPTRDLSLMFALSYNELLLLEEILNHTLITIEIEKLLSN